MRSPRTGRWRRTPRSRSRPIRRASRLSASAATAPPGSTASRSASRRSNDNDLRLLGRLHDVATARAAIETARATFPRLSFDLIYARPGQTPEAWAAELREALSLAADHLSLYQLTIEDGTPFAALHRAGKLKMPDEDTAAELYAVTLDTAAAAGLPAYEISNHARPGAECRHNLVYWRYGEYAGIGPGAHGRLVLHDGRHATATEKLPEDWLARVEERGDGLIVDDLLTPEEEGDEMLLMGLRLAEGIDLARYRTIAGRTLDPEQLADLVAHGMVERTVDGRAPCDPRRLLRPRRGGRRPRGVSGPLAFQGRSRISTSE